MSTHSGEPTCLLSRSCPSRTSVGSCWMAEWLSARACAGRTLKEKQRKQYVERRLEDIDKDACQLRLQLKRLG